MPLERMSNGLLWSCTSIGSYPLIYITTDGGELCPACANGDNGSEASEDSEDAQWRLAGVRVLWEGPPTRCYHCYVDIESAYGDPDAADG